MLSSQSQEPVVYLDVDGVIFPYELIEIPSMYGGKSEVYLKSREHCEPHIRKALAALAVETVLSSSRQQEFFEGFSYIAKELGIERALDIDPVDSANIHLKRDAILRDQREQPRPYIWVDDHISSLPAEVIEEMQQSHTSLLVVPDRMVGLTLSEIETVGQFISRQKR